MDNARAPVVVEDPILSLRSVQEAMDRIFNDSLLSSFGRTSGWGMLQGAESFSPRVDISETEQEVRVRAELPGMDPKDVTVEVTDDSLSLSGTLERSAEEKQENYYRIERGYGRFSREFVLPAKVDVDSVKAEAKDGVITITLQKQPSAKKKKVAIST